MDDSVRFSDLPVMGISGGIVPCPEVPGFLPVAIGFSFSPELAVVLIGPGVLLVRFTPLTRLCWQRLTQQCILLLVTILCPGIFPDAFVSKVISLEAFIAVQVAVVRIMFVYAAATRIFAKRSMTRLLTLLPIQACGCFSD